MKAKGLLLCVLSLVVATCHADKSTPVVPDWAKLLLSHGPVADANCNMEVIQTINDEYLHNVLEQLVNTTYFRLFGLSNTKGGCPLRPDTEDGEDEDFCPSSKKPEPEISTSPGSAFGAPPKPEGGLCTVDLGADDKNAAADAFGFGGGGGGGFGGGGGGFGGGAGGLGASSSSSSAPPTGDSEPVDRTISNFENDALAAGGAQAPDDNCNDDTKPEFWMNICDKLETSTTEFVNLQRNPESYTGYNGTEVWNAIYEENCFANDTGIHDEMCYEERIMYRLLSGMHASINIHISENYYPPRKGKRDEWAPNPDRFMTQIGAFPDRIKNLHFSFVVLLRALRKAAPSLYHLSYVTGDPQADEGTQALMQQLLDSHVMSSCADVFNAFDESLMFRPSLKHKSTISHLKREFKAVFHNISTMLNCVTCQKCRLHGKLQLLGVGTALKVLLLPEDLVSTSLERNEIVALVNTVAKFSHAIATAPRLMELYWRESHINKPRPSPAMKVATSAPTLEIAVSAVFDAAEAGFLSRDHENVLIDLAMQHSPELLTLAKVYNANNQRFAEHAVRSILGAKVEAKPDAIVVGCGLGGLVASLAVLDRGGSVVMIEKESLCGGNSAKASSGINGVDEYGVSTIGDSVELFAQDVIKGSGIPEYKDNPLVYALANGSEQALRWLRTRVGIPLELRGQLGGHSKPRTHRPENGMAGSELVAAVKAKVTTFLKEDNPRIQLHVKSSVESLIHENGAAVGVKYKDLQTGQVHEVRGHHVILATGGFANDFAGLIPEVRPELAKFSTTNGRFATGDGHRMAQAIGAGAVDMANIQLHPTAFVDRADKDAKVKTLCAEILRGVGGVLVDSTGHRFCNELGTRDYISNTMLANAEKNGVDGQPAFGLILNAEAASHATKHISTYTKKGLLVKVRGIRAVAEYLGVPVDAVRVSLASYEKSADSGVDEFGKTVFKSLPVVQDDENDEFYVGEVTPALHYCMGGLVIDEFGKVQSERENAPIPGLFAVGELTGGIHGKNRLGGNALTECVVFGYKVGSEIAIRSGAGPSSVAAPSGASTPSPDPSRTISKEELAEHNSNGDVWVALHGNVYDLTDFVDEHPGGASSITELAGKDGTHEYEEVHSPAMLEDFEPIGVFHG